MTRTVVAAARGALIVLPLVLSLWLAGVPLVLAESPNPTSVTAGDPRSSGQGPGLVGDPGTAIAVVLLIAVASILATAAYLRCTGPKGSDSRAR